MCKESLRMYDGSASLCVKGIQAYTMLLVAVFEDALVPVGTLLTTRVA